MTKTLRNIQILMATLLLLLAAGLAGAAGPEILDAAIATGVEDREPIGKGQSFPADVGRLYAFTRVAGAAEVGVVRHVWYHAGKVMAEVELPVRSDSWRTWSSKTILPQWTGEWRVEVATPGGEVLASVPFSVE